MIKLPRTGMGTAPLGGLFEAVSDETAHATIELAWERGIRFFDTAPLYGLGLSEQRLGRFLAGQPRDDFVLATKVGRLLRADAPAEPREAIWKGVPAFNPVFDFSYDGVLRSVDESLERLGLDRIDVLHIHDPDDHYEEAMTGAYPALDRLRSEGVVGAVGAGMNQVEMLLRFAREAEFDCFLVAGRYTLLDQAALQELLPLCAERGIAVIAGGLFNSGLLAGGTTFNYRPAPSELVERAAQLDAMCARHDVPLAAAALQFPLRHPAVTSILLGPRSPAQLAQSLDLLDVPIPSGLWDELLA
jgi:D-threo-aldose 1-dehydrogenase